MRTDTYHDRYASVLYKWRSLKVNMANRSVDVPSSYHHSPSSAMYTSAGYTILVARVETSQLVFEKFTVDYCL